MSIKTAEEITNLYLYGSTTLPANLADESLIRPRNTAPLEISVNGNDFMQTGPGRIALPVLWDVVNQFFDLNRGLQPGTYTEQQLRTMFGISKDDAVQTLQQYNYDDGLDNYAERFYIWNSGSYEIDDSAVFVVDENGNRHIEHFAVIPLGPKDSSGSHGGILDNFDFEGGGMAKYLNGALEAMVDPSGIGIKVNIEITNVTNFRSYTIADFVADKQKYDAYYVDTASAAARMVTEGYDLVTRLFDNGSIKFLDSDNKPILYGSDGDDVISGTTSKAYKDGTSANIAATLHPLSGWIQNGIHYIGGAGNDILTGTGYDDTLEGGEDNDLIDGSQGNDTLDGGTGSDQLKGGDGQDTYQVDSGDILEDSDGQGEVWLANMQLHGGVKKSGESQYTDNQGHRYQLIGSTLLVSGAGGSLAINHFNKENKDLGIDLRDDDKNDGGPLGGFPAASGITSPIVLDLNGDGLTTVSVDDGVYFDHDGNGFAELTGWINRQDGLLVRDLNGDGNITSGRELFGSNTLLADGRKAGNGYLALAELDGNHDGLIDAQDAAYAELKIWQDQNGDGRSQTQELLSLSQAQVQSIATAYTDSSQTDHGNALKQIGNYLRADGSVGQSADLWFQANAIYSVPTDPLPETPAVAALPNASGYRNVYDLHQAMLHDGSGQLQALVQQFADAPAGQRFALVDDLIFTWLGVDSVPIDSRGGYIDARKLCVLETFTDRQFIQGSGTNIGTPNPGPNAANYLTGLYNDLAGIVYQELMDSYFTPLLDSVRFNWNAATGRFDPDVTDTAAALRQLYTQGGNALLDIGAFADILNRHGDLGTTILNALLLRDDLGSDLTWFLAANSASQSGSDGNDALLARPNGDQLFGLVGEDMLIGSAGADLLDGGAGNDQLTGGPGNDIYWLHPGDGQDTIYDFDTIQGNQDSLLFDIRIVPSDVSLMRDGYELLVRFNGSDQITVQNFGAGSEYRIEQINFTDGTRWLAGQFYTQLTGMPIIGSDSDDLLVTWFDENGLIQGLGGNDSLYGNNGNDTLAGGAGNDTLLGGSGNDDYLFNPGDGQDIFIEDDNSPANLDTIRLGAGIASAGVALARSGYDWVVSLTNSNDRLTVQNFGLNDSHQIERIAFADGTVWDGDYLHGLITLAPSVGTDADDTLSAWVGYGGILQGLAGNDMLNGADGNDTLEGSLGADTLLGGSGNDDYLFNPGDGQDILIEDDHTPANLDTIRFGAGITDVALARSGYDLVVSIANSNDRLTIKNFGLSDSHKIERIAFADGTVWEAAHLQGLIALAPAVGSSGNDILNAWVGYDSLLQGLAGNDMLNGANGNDTLDGGLGADTLIGGAGDDYYVADSFGDVVSAALGQGIDTLERSFESNYYLADNVENLIITGTVYLGHGNTLDNRMTGNAADNHLAGWEGNDTLYGLDGHDSLFGGTGADTLVGGAGDDYYQIDDAADAIVEAAYEGDELARSTVSYALPDNVERLALDGSADLSATGNDLNNNLWGNSGNNILSGSAGDDSLSGNEGVDILYGNAGDDALFGGTGADTLVGGAGDDYYQIDDAADTLIEASDEGNDMARSTVSYALPDNVERLALDGSVDLSVTGNGLNNGLWGNIGNNPMYGLVGNDVLYGGAGADALDGGVDNDSLYGDEGDDLLIGSVGNDYLAGNAGNDIYVFNRGDGQDTIDNTDLSTASDVLRFGVGIADSDVLAFQTGDSVYLKIKNSSDHVYFSHYYGADIINGNAVSDHKIDRVEFANGVVWSSADLQTQLDRATNNHFPTINFFLPTLVAPVGLPFTYTVPTGAITDPDPWDSVAYSAALADGSLLPAWLSFDANTLTFSGIPDANSYGILQIRLIGTDNYGFSSYETVTFLDFATPRQLTGTDGNDTLNGGYGNDTLMGLASNDRLLGQAGADTMIGGSGDDYYEVDDPGDTLTELAGEGNDDVRSTISFTLPDNIERLIADGAADLSVTGNALNNGLWGNVGNNQLYGLAGNDVLYGGAGADALDGGIDNDSLYGDEGDDLLIGSTGNDYLAGNAGNDIYVFNRGDGQDTIDNTDLSTASDVLRFGAGIADSDVLAFQTGDNVYLKIKNSSDHVYFSHYYGADIINGNTVSDHKIDRVEFANGVVWNQGDLQALVDRATNNHFPTINFFLPTLVAPVGLPFTYTVPTGAITDPDPWDSVAYSATLADGSPLPAWLGFDANTLTFSGIPDANSYGTLQIRLIGTDDYNFSSYETVTFLDFATPRQLTGTDGDDTLSGGYGNDTLMGLASNDRLLGQAGADTMIGGSGDDYYEVDDPGDTLTELAGEGNDDVRSTISFTLPDNIERLIADGAADLSITGNALNNGLWGNVGNNQLYGLAGNDVLYGGAGADALDGGVDNDSLYGDEGDDLLIGSVGNDYLAGNAGNDTYLFNVGDGQDTIDNTDAQAAVDTLRFGAGIGEANVTVRVSGDSLYLNINGSGDRVWLNHYYAADTVNGDVTQDHKLDRVEFADGLVWNQADLQVQADRATNNHSPVINSFLPTLQARAGSAFDYTVPVDTITDPDPWDAVSYSAKLPDGSALPAWLHFDVSNRIFSGTPGSGDVGSLSFILWGTDNYGFSSGEYVNLNVASPNRPPVVAAPLTDQSATLGNPFNYMLPATAFTDPDADPLSYSATLADGSALPVWLVFNPATRVFNGTPDALMSIGVLVTATDEGGLSASDVFGIDVSIQNLTLTGTSGANALSGGAGHDVLNGLGGNDTLIGNAGNDTLDGGSGNDTLQGGADDDNYVVNSAGDAVIENPGEGNDSVQAGVNYTLAANVENLTLTGSSSLSATGNELNNVLTGNSATNTLTGAAGNDRLDGKAGADKMIGRTGDDIYVVDKSTDTVTENANEGTDGVESSVTLTLAANVENLTLTGTSAINGTGNGLANALTGNNANNSLSGAAGNDSLDGKGGNDTLTGGIGGDSYMMARGYATDTVVDSDGTAGNNDLVQFLSGISADQIWFTHPSGGSNLTASIIGTNDSITIKDWYLGTANHVEQFKTYEDHRLLSDGNVQNLVDAMAGFTPPILGQTTLPDNYLTLLAPVIADNWMAY